MKTYQVTYSGNSTRFANFNSTINATSAREAAIKVYSRIMDDSFFPQEDGSINDCDGHTINDGPEDNYIEHDGGYFSAEEIQ